VLYQRSLKMAQDLLLIMSGSPDLRYVDARRGAKHRLSPWWVEAQVKRLVLFLGVLTAFGGGVDPISARAAVTYTYVGHDFTDVVSPYTTADKVTGSFALAAALSDDLSNYDIPRSSILSFSFSDGVQTITNTTPDTGPVSFFDDISTNGEGDITSWYIEVTKNENDYVDTRNTTPASSADKDLGVYLGSGDDFGHNENEPGTFTVSFSVPEPTSVVSLGIGLLALGFLCNRRKKFRAT
jgi:hypothetical protein